MTKNKRKAIQSLIEAITGQITAAQDAANAPYANQQYPADIRSRAHSRAVDLIRQYDEIRKLIEAET